MEMHRMHADAWGLPFKHLCYAPPMARPLRLEFAGGIYHVTSRGDRREDIYLDDEDRADWMEVLCKACNRYK